MLVLARSVGDAIEIDGGITIKVVSIRGGVVRLGIVAPNGTKILRGELVDTEPKPKEGRRRER